MTGEIPIKWISDIQLNYFQHLFTKEEIQQLTYYHRSIAVSRMPYV